MQKFQTWPNEYVLDPYFSKLIRWNQLFELKRICHSLIVEIKFY